MDRNNKQQQFGRIELLLAEERGAGSFDYLSIGRRWKLIDGQTCST
jgi:hypothetical protein